MAASVRLGELADHVRHLRRYALALTRDRHKAEDLVQECLTRAIAAADRLRPDAPLRPWLFRILHNVHISQERRRQVQDAVIVSSDAEASGEAPQLAHLELRDVVAALDRLPDGQREAVLLMALEDLPYQEAAEVLGVPLGTFMSRLSRGRKALRTMVEGEERPRLRVIGDRP
jgi:RNA polymerase sigma factor (sigma-70 family)